MSPVLAWANGIYHEPFTCLIISHHHSYLIIPLSLSLSHFFLFLSTPACWPLSLSRRQSAAAALGLQAVVLRPVPTRSSATQTLIILSICPILTNRVLFMFPLKKQNGRVFPQIRGVFRELSASMLLRASVGPPRTFRGFCVVLPFSRKHVKGSSKNGCELYRATISCQPQTLLLTLPANCSGVTSLS